MPTTTATYEVKAVSDLQAGDLAARADALDTAHRIGRYARVEGTARWSDGRTLVSWDNGLTQTYAAWEQFHVSTTT